MDRIYFKFTDGVLSENTPLGAALLKVIPMLCNEGQMRENFLKIKTHLLSKEAKQGARPEEDGGGMH